ncbi:hypothetical protein [Chlamydia felis Fe/C-56]|uniref:Uncharacterized protein n=1 Tax=Chlamydia felis (strain Fe/C-56) TaxID=264202 RepID=Q256G8_CHLFF|nr:hypothetical protein [Chlamydia felis]BAE80820.1 hypothetical protein [Chlamydia felis Fe/C-56]
MIIQEQLTKFCPSVVHFVQTHQLKLSQVNKCFFCVVLVGIVLIFIGLAATSPIFVTIISGVTLLCVSIFVVLALLLRLGQGSTLLQEPGSESITIENLHLTER